MRNFVCNLSYPLTCLLLNSNIQNFKTNDKLVRALLVEGLPKDVKSDLRSDAVTHWNLILPQIVCIIVVLKVLKLPRECSHE